MHGMGDNAKSMLPTFKDGLLEVFIFLSDILTVCLENKSHFIVSPIT